MYQKYIDILKEVYRLAKERSNEYHQSQQHQVLDMADIDIDDLTTPSELLNYLHDQDVETLKVIQTAMYLGREHYPETPDEAEERILHNSENPDDKIPCPPLKSDSPVELFNEWYAESFNDNSKFEIADQIDSKMTLDEYLEKAFIILDI